MLPLTKNNWVEGGGFTYKRLVTNLKGIVGHYSFLGMFFIIVIFAGTFVVSK